MMMLIVEGIDVNVNRNMSIICGMSFFCFYIILNGIESGLDVIN